MSLQTGQSVSVNFTLTAIRSNLPTNADTPPIGTVIINGVDTSTAVTITNTGTGTYTATFTLPALSVNDEVELNINATVAGVTDNSIVFQDSVVGPPPASFPALTAPATQSTIVGNIKSAETIGLDFTLRSVTTGFMQNADTPPGATVYLNGQASATVVGITNDATGRYTATFTLPSLNPGTTVALAITASVDGRTETNTIFSDTIIPEAARAQPSFAVPFVIDTSQNYLVWDACEPIIFGSANKSMGNQQAKHVISNQEITVGLAKRRAPTTKELSTSNGAYTGADLVWIIPRLEYQTGFPPPKPGDYVLDNDGVQWTILPAGVSFNALKSDWKCFTRNLVLAYQLYDLIDIQRPAISYDAAGAIVRSWPDDAIPQGATIAYQLPAKVQLLTQQSSLALGVSGMRGDYAVIINKDLELVKSDRVAWYTPKGTVYLDILAQHNPQRIDELPVLDCQALP
jgi:hypothetical protein